ncbi:MAG: tetraacyldisaccharide 4'-kinase [Candidatus Rokubacteria bacterium]|nr:tetraacyldisaccharide 4'-kinase [Candidatus Rokubacteria bacterium]
MSEARARRSDPESWLLRAWEEGTHPVLAAGLGGLAVGYRCALAARERLYDLGVLRTGRLPCPVISIGNLTVGGSGKTPLVELAALTLAELGARPAVVSRGYRRDTRGVQVVADRAGIRLGPRAAGDEPVLLAERLPGMPVVVGENRYEAGRLALEALGASVIVLDDAFQNRTIAKDVEVVAVSARAPWGNGRLFPAGPLREPLGALRRAHLVVVTNGGRRMTASGIPRMLERHGCTAPVVGGGYEVVGVRDTGGGERLPPHVVQGRRLLGFAGLASPRSFRETLACLGVALAGFVEFQDHHWYAAEDLSALVRQADVAGAEGLITTEKDWVRLRGLPPPPRPVWVLSVRMVLDPGHAAWHEVLGRALGGSVAAS